MVIVWFTSLLVLCFLLDSCKTVYFYKFSIYKDILTCDEKSPLNLSEHLSNHYQQIVIGVTKFSVSTD